MGGFGSGRWTRSEAKARTVDYKSVDIRRLARINALEAGTEVRFDSGEFLKVISVGLSLEVLFFSDNFLQNGRVSVRFRPCVLGGQRALFVCPACHRSVFLLYKRHGSFKCRQCSELSYVSQSEDPVSRAMRKTTKLIRKLSPEACLMTGVPDKPKGMHRATYCRISIQAEHRLSQVMPQWAAIQDQTRELVNAASLGATADIEFEVGDWLDSWV